jgi:hypothetical protein
MGLRKHEEANLDVFSLFVNRKMPLKQPLSHGNVPPLNGTSYAILGAGSGLRDSRYGARGDSILDLGFRISDFGFKNTKHWVQGTMVSGVRFQVSGNR